MISAIQMLHALCGAFSFIAQKYKQLNGIYRFAEKNIEISSSYSEVHELCRDYRTEDGADFLVQVKLEDITYERERSAREAELEGLPIVSYPNSYLETLAVYRKIAEWMPSQDTFLFHGSCLAIDGTGCLFAAKSGIGKSTHAQLWKRTFGDRVAIVNDDKPLIKKVGDHFVVYGTPWDGKHRRSSNISVPLEYLYLLTRSEENFAEKVDPEAVYPFLLQQCYRPADPDALARTLSLLDAMTVSVRLFRLHCNMDPEAAVIAYEGMSLSK